MRLSGVSAPGQAQTILEVSPVTTPSEHYRLIPLTQGQFAIVDGDDFARLSTVRWHIRPTTNGRFYAVRTVAGKKNVRMHREILGLTSSDAVEVDHVNGNGLDNRKANLRIADKRQNQWNRGVARNNTSGYKGVTFCKRTKRWQAQITVMGKFVFLGRHDSPEQAYQAYCTAAESLHGEFSCL